MLPLFVKIDDNRLNDNNDFSYDSLKWYNEKFEEAITNSLKKNPNTINYQFKKLQDAGLVIKTSADKKLRIYYWDDMQGGTMRFINNVMQIQQNKQQRIIVNEDDGYLPTIDTLKTKDNTHYIITRTLKGSSVVFIHFIEIYTINSKAELVRSPIIKTAKHFTHKLNCDVDYSAKVNRDSEDFITSNITYNPDKREISLPLIRANGKVTTDKIVYRFNGKAFEKVR